MHGYTLDKCSVYRDSIFDLSIPVYIFKKHNYALPVWGMVSSKVGKRLKLITFDTHTDTRAPFSGIILRHGGNPDDGIKDSTVTRLLKDKKYSRDSFVFEDVYRISSWINNDEQIKTAFDFDYICSYHVVHRKNAEDYEDYDKTLKYKCKYYDYDNIDWTELNNVDSPIALDFDLDFFHCRGDIGETFENNIKKLINRASIITIATEPEYFENETTEKGFSNSDALEGLMSIIRKYVC